VRAPVGLPSLGVDVEVTMNKAFFGDAAMDATKCEKIYISSLKERYYYFCCHPHLLSRVRLECT
jgi:hypothetical protein